MENSNEHQTLKFQLKEEARSNSLFSMPNIPNKDNDSNPEANTGGESKRKMCNKIYLDKPEIQKSSQKSRFVFLYNAVNKSKKRKCRNFIRKKDLRCFTRSNLNTRELKTTKTTNKLKTLHKS